MRQLNHALQVTLRKIQVLLRHCTPGISCKLCRLIWADGRITLLGGGLEFGREASIAECGNSQGRMKGRIEF